MQTRSITKIVDLLASQRRVVIWLRECPHKVSITEAQLASMPRDTLDMLKASGQIDCPFCPSDPEVSSSAPVNVRKLYKDAGEP